MKNAARTMYIIGRIISIIGIVLGIAALVIGILFKANDQHLATQFAKQGITRYDSLREVNFAGNLLIIVASILIATQTVEFILATKADHAILNGTKEEWPHILLIVIGVLGNLFFALGGIFGLIQSENNNN